MQEQGEAKREEKAERTQVVYCPVCGEPMGPWGMRYHRHHMGPWGAKPWGMGYMARWGGPWAGYAQHTGHWMPGPMGMVWAGVVPALVGFALGYVLASARMGALYAFACEEKRRH